LQGDGETAIASLGRKACEADDAVHPAFDASQRENEEAEASASALGREIRDAIAAAEAEAESAVEAVDKKTREAVEGLRCEAEAKIEAARAVARAARQEELKLRKASEEAWARFRSACRQLRKDGLRDIAEAFLSEELGGVPVPQDPRFEATTQVAAN